MPATMATNAPVGPPTCNGESYGQRQRNQADRPTGNQVRGTGLIT
jgi:hypothetical protein